MKDFAARAMMKVMVAGAKRQNINLVAMADDNLQHLANATVPLANKRDALGSIQENCGLCAILNLGQGIHEVDDEPMKLVFLNARTPADFFLRWERMQKFVHSRHRLQCREVSPKEFELRHISLTGKPPQVAETCLVMSVVVALLSQRFGTNLSLVDEHNRASHDGQNWTLTGEPIPESPWTFVYQSQLPQISAINSYSASACKPAELEEKLRMMFRKDPCFKWTLQSAAGRLCQSTRTLQRRLTARLTSFTRILVNERVLLASELLVQSDASLTEIGFVAGFNSSSHFTTLFRRATGMSPGQFRNISVSSSR